MKNWIMPAIASERAVIHHVPAEAGSVTYARKYHTTAASGASVKTV